MKKQYLFLLILIGLFACSNTPQLPNTPEDTTRLWLKWNDENNFELLESISSGSTLELIKYIEKSIEGLSDEEMETAPTVIQKISCITQNNQSKCTYCCNEGEEEVFELKKNNGQWKVDKIIPTNNAETEEVWQEKMLDSLLNM